MKKTASIVVAFALLSMVMPASAAIMDIDFETGYVSGNIHGQDGWQTLGPWGVGDPVDVGTTTSLSPVTMCIDDGNPLGGSWNIEYWKAIPITLDPTKVYTLEFDCVAGPGNNQANGGGFFGFRSGQYAGNLIGVGGVPVATYFMDPRGISTSSWFYGTHLVTTQLHVKMVLDGPNDTIETLVDDGTGYVTYGGPLALKAGGFASVTDIGGYQSSGGRIEVDNILLTPEPATLAVLGIGGILALLRRKR